ncbi:cytochrome c peroxidase [Sphingomonas sp. H39-1-10]|uniref:cytochrome-c peroxidase n=1 Tax=Sphingomonas pollutisoli TaxID=3030829 RepID=UPI0023B8E335|nr:cytochrome c peroxidase [Sphingomonas pollutisoli]MDF0487869.1 cytochrome c peroxidase [Sphingomonas pollutisoli]
MPRFPPFLILCAASAALVVAAVTTEHAGARAEMPQSQTEGEDADDFGRDEPISPLPRTVPADTARIRLGAELFGDPRLSEHGRVSCASCHDLETNGATGDRVDRGDDGTASSYNTPTVFNAGLNFRRNWEGRPRTTAQLLNRIFRLGRLMGRSPEPGLRRLRADRAMSARFRAVYKRDPDEAAVSDALIAFMATLTTPDARFDRWLRGDAGALSAQEKRGYARFKAVGCASCHQGRNVGGNLLERHGIFHQSTINKPQLLRVPSLRNVAVTAPYFHDGQAKELPIAVRTMGRAQLDVLLSTRDASDIAAFLRTLTGQYRGRDLRQAAARPDS